MCEWIPLALCRFAWQFDNVVVPKRQGFESRSSFLLREKGENSFAKINDAMRDWISGVVCGWLHALCIALLGS